MNETSRHVADAKPGGWVERALPASALPYAQLMRLDRPIGWWLLLLPCWWGLALAQIARGDTMPDLWAAFLFLLGAIVMRGAGCTVNDIADRDIDAKVARTRSRPLPSRRVSLKAATAFLILQCVVGGLVLLQFNWVTITLGISSLLIVAIYPFMKRITYWPQAVLGLAFNWGALLGWSSIWGGLSLAPLLLYGGGLLWTLSYDTIYAHQDMEDDVLVGVKSTALKFGQKSKMMIALFFAGALMMIDAAVWVAGGDIWSHMGVALAGLHGVWQISKFRHGDSPTALMLFKSNRNFGLLITAGFLVNIIVR